MYYRPEANIFASHVPIPIPDKMYRPLIRGFAAKQLSNALPPGAVRTVASAHATPQLFNWEDPLGSKNLLTEEELAIAETAESYCQERMLPRVLGRLAFRIIPSTSANSNIVPQTHIETSIMTRRSSRKWES